MPSSGSAAPTQRSPVRMAIGLKVAILPVETSLRSRPAPSTRGPSIEPLRKTSRRSAGSTLVEVLGGAVIVAIAIPGILYTTVQVAMLRRADEERNMAMVGCQGKIEDLRDLPPAGLAACHGSGFAVDVDQDSVNDLAPLPNDPDGLPGELSIVVEEATSEKVLYRVRATVRWSGQSGARAFWLETLMTDRRGH